MYLNTKNLIIILGPTAVGKSSLAILVAKNLKGEIINCDSMQVYRGFDIGTDKISQNQQEGIHHHLLDIKDSRVQFNAADFVKLAAEAIDNIRINKHLPIITGGTGLYIKALLEGLFPEGNKNPLLREKLEKETDKKGIEFQWKKLSKIDPDYSEKISPKDRLRIIRALEVFYNTNITITAHFKNTKPALYDYNIIKIGLDMERADLYSRIETRVDYMFDQGLVQETKNLLDSGIPENAPPFRALGYNQVLAFLRKEISLEQAIEFTKKETRHYAKRQLTWFKKREGITWFHPSERTEILNCIKKKLQQ